MSALRNIRLTASLFVLWPMAQPCADSPAPSVVAAGHYLAIVGDCEACHTAAGGAPFAGGLAIQTPFGTLVSPNITPDMKTGIGAMSDAAFLQALHDGVAPRGHLYPGFPYPYFTKVSDNDALAIRVWLNTLPPVTHAVTPNQLPFPFDKRSTA